MHRIDTSTATPDHKFTEGDPTVPVAATTVSAAWLNAVQEELVATITKAGLELEKSDNGQLAAAIAKLISTAVDAVRVSPATTVPKAPGTAATGSSAKYAREDHVHPVQTSVSGSAGSAAKLSTARTILVNLASTTAGSFDGTKNITPGVSGTLPTARGGTGRTDGKAAALATARTITLSGDVTGNVSFDGSKNVTIQTTVASLGGAVPIGGIIPFSGTFGGEGNRFPIPLGEDEPLSNWCLCDGTTTNDLPVPDLRGRMILGVSTTYKAGSKGGSASHTHSLSGTVGSGPRPSPWSRCRAIGTVTRATPPRGARAAVMNSGTQIPRKTQGPRAALSPIRTRWTGRLVVLIPCPRIMPCRTSCGSPSSAAGAVCRVIIRCVRHCRRHDAVGSTAGQS